MIKIEQYTSAYYQDVVKLITSIQQNEFNIPITYEQQPDLANIADFFNMFWVAIYAGHIIGTIGLKLITDFAVIRKMFILENFRGTTFNAAKKLLTTLEVECNLQNIHKIYLGTTEHFKAAHRFYEKNNYLEIPSKDLPKEFPIMHVDKKFYFKQLVF